MARRRATRGDADHAAWELRYLRRALGILVAQRDALDDRTPSEVLRTLASRMARDPNVDGELRELADRQFNARLSAYRDAFTSRGPRHARRRASRRTCSRSPADRSAPTIRRWSAAPRWWRSTWTRPASTLARELRQPGAAGGRAAVASGTVAPADAPQTKKRPRDREARFFVCSMLEGGLEPPRR